MRTIFVWRVATAFWVTLSIGLALLATARLRTLTHVTFPAITINHVLWIGGNVTNELTRVKNP
jgi:hypothetical protein